MDSEGSRGRSPDAHLANFRLQIRKIFPVLMQTLKN